MTLLARRGVRGVVLLRNTAAAVLIVFTVIDIIAAFIAVDVAHLAAAPAVL